MKSLKSHLFDMPRPTLSKTIGVVLVFCAATAAFSQAQTFTTLVVFNDTNGSQPFMSLVQGSDGNLYGATKYGGQAGVGTVFKMTPAGALTTLHSFAGSPTDGSEPYAGLVLGTDGNFYGTTEAGGANGYGTVFKIRDNLRNQHAQPQLCHQLPHRLPNDPLHSFDLADSGTPWAALVQATNGNFYGTTV
jgi:uncharacterized repeat protein (TIGR03803 family)